MGAGRGDRKRIFAVFALIGAFGLAEGINGCTHSPGPGGPSTIPVASTTFKDGGDLAASSTCGGAGNSPPLSWTDLPTKTKSLAVTCLDPDAPSGTFTHWLVYAISPDTTSIPEGGVPSGARQGINDFGSVGYGAPCPPQGNPHHYVFTVYALDNIPDVKQGGSRDDLFAAMQGHVLAKGQITGMYGRS